MYSYNPTILLRIQSKFLIDDDVFPNKSESEFLSKVNSIIYFYRTEIFNEPDEDDDICKCPSPDLRSFPNIEQKLFANEIVTDLICDICDGYFELILEEPKNDLYADFYLHDFRRKAEKQRKQILLDIINQKVFNKVYKEYGIHLLEEEIEFLEEPEEQAEAINKYIFEFEQNPEAVNLLPSNLLKAKNMLSNLLIGRWKRQELETNNLEMSGSTDETSKDAAHIFKGNSSYLFNYLMEECVTRRRGQQSDIAYFFRRMVNEGLIKCQLETFKTWLFHNYDWVDPFDKIKTLNDVKNDKRHKIYNNAKDIIKRKNEHIRFLF